MQIIQQAPDVVFLDIEMPFYNGFDLLDCVKNLKKVPIIVFITGYDKYLPLVKTNNEVFILLKPMILYY
jgi:two-component system LytT family response regulator